MSFKYLPEYVVDTYDALFVRVLGVADESGAGLHPAVPALLVHDPVVVAHHLALVQQILMSFPHLVNVFSMD